MSMCRRPCEYKSLSENEAGYDRACNYLWMMDPPRSRTMTIADMFGIEPGSPEHHELMKPENCPLFKPVKRKKVIADAYGAKKLRKVRPYVPPADEKLLLELYARGLSDYAIGMKVDAAESRIRWWRKKRGLAKHKQPAE